MDTEDAARIRSAIFERTSPVARDAIGSMEEDMWQTQDEADRGVTDATPYGYETVWSQVGTRDFEREAPGWNMDASEVRRAYRLVSELDTNTLEAFDREEAYGLAQSIQNQAKDAGQTEATDEEQDGAVTCPRCDGKMGFSKFAHVPHKHVGGLCFLCHGKGAVLVDDAEAFLAKQKADKDARVAKERARADEQKAVENQAHREAFDRYGDEYRLVYALARYDHQATTRCVFDLNAYRHPDQNAMLRVRDQIPYIVQNAGLDGLGLEEIEALGTIDID